MGKFIDISGQRYGRLKVLNRCGTGKNGDAIWRCLCECGNEISVRKKSLTSESTVSCGCYKKEHLLKKNTTHGMSRSKEYKVWASMIQRCTNPSSTGYENYGERGISVCERWLKFENFISDMGAKPSMLHSIERIDNNVGYCPDNCCWASREAQDANKRNTRLIKTKKGLQPVFIAAIENNLPARVIRNRIRAGWEESKIINTPVHRRILMTPMGEMRLSDAARSYGIAKHVLHLRLSRGWSVEKSLTTPVRKKMK